MDVVDQFARFLDPLSILIVFGGALIAAIVRSTGEDIGRAFGALGPLFTASPERDSDAARHAVSRIAAIAELRGLQCADRIETAGRFLSTASRRLSDAESPAAFARWAEEELAARRQRHDGAIGFWTAMADAAPAMGLIGTVAGLIQMFAGMSDPGSIGPAMALALTTTLYGVVVANAFAGPIAARLERLSAAERAWQEATISRLVALAERELDRAQERPRAALRTVA